MENSFFKKKEVGGKCNYCLISKKCKIENKIKDNTLIKRGNGDILFILERSYLQDDLRSKQIVKFDSWLREHLINDYELVFGLGCEFKELDPPNPLYKLYRTCNLIKESNTNCKVIVTVGRALFAITQSDDLVSWREFAEYKFNQTYFYTSFKWEKKIRVYPIPALFDWIEQENFESWFSLYQINQVKNYLQNYSEYKFPSYKITKVENPDEFLKNNMNKKEIAWDLETSSLDMFSSDFKIKCLTISFDGIEGYYLPFEKINKRLLSQFFINKYGILANGKYDMKCLWVKGIKTPVQEEDITLLHHCLDTQRLTNSLKSLAWLIGFGGYDEKLENYIEEYRVNSYYDIPERILIEYSVLDSIITYRLYKYELELSKLQPKIYEYYRKYLIPVIPVYMSMETEGILINKEYLNRLNEELTQKEEKLKKEINDYFNEEFDINSPKQLAIILEKNKFTNLGRSEKTFYKDQKGNKVGVYTTGDSQLQQWLNEKPDIVQKIIEHRAVNKLKTSFVGEIKENKVKEEFLFEEKGSQSDKLKKIEGLVKFIKQDGKIHCSYSPGRTDSIRSSCESPNIQQLPHQGNEGKIFRPIIGCPEGYIFMEADYSGFQLRIGAIYSGDEKMKDIFLNKGGDLHSMTARAVFCRKMILDEFMKKKKEEPYKSYRFRGKSINFGFLFGQSAYGFKPVIENEWNRGDIEEYIAENELELKVNEMGEVDYVLTVSEDIRNKFFNTYSKLNPWIQRQHEFGKKEGYIDSIHGVRRHLPQLTNIGKDYDKRLNKNLLNIAVNSPVQAFEAIVAYKSLILLSKAIREKNLQSKIIAMVHDSIVCYVKKEEIKIMYQLLKECLEDHTSWDIPILVDIQIGEIWGFGEEIHDEKDLDKWMK